MDKEIEKESLSGTLKLSKNKAIEKSEDTIVPPLSSAPESKPNFNAIYDELHGKFPEIINMDKPVLLAVGIRKEMSKETSISSVVLKRWIAWYCRKSNYYAIHKQGAMRFNLDGSEAGIVTEKHQEKMDKRLEKTKTSKTPPPRENKSKDSDNDLSDSPINNVGISK